MCPASSRTNPPMCVCLWPQPLSPPLETSSVNFSLSVSSPAPFLAAALRSNTNVQIFCIYCTPHRPRRTLALLSSLLCQRTSKGTLPHLSPTHHSKVAWLLRSHSQQCHQWPWPTGLSLLIPLNLPLVCANTTSSLLKHSLWDSFMLHFPGSLPTSRMVPLQSFLLSRSYSRVSSLAFPSKSSSFSFFFLLCSP